MSEEELGSDIGADASGGDVDNSQGEQTTERAAISTDAPQAIVIPEDYKGKGWASKKFADQNALFKEIDELHSLKGKKSAPFDYSTATEAEISEYIKATTPESIDAYNWGEDGSFSDDDKTFFGEMLREAGVEPYKANKLIETSQKRQAELKEQLYGKDGFESILQESFKSEGDWKKAAGNVANSLKAHTTKADQEMLAKIPNEALGLLYRIHNNALKAYGIKEGEDRGAGNAAPVMSGEALDSKRTSLRNEINSLKGKIGSHEKIAKLNKELTATYTQNLDPRLRKA